VARSSSARAARATTTCWWRAWWTGRCGPCLRPGGATRRRCAAAALGGVCVCMCLRVSACVCLRVCVRVCLVLEQWVVRGTLLLLSCLCLPICARLMPAPPACWRTQILEWVLSYDGVNQPEPLAITAAAAALLISGGPRPLVALCCATLCRPPPPSTIPPHPPPHPTPPHHPASRRTRPHARQRMRPHHAMRHPRRHPAGQGRGGCARRLPAGCRRLGDQPQRCTGTRAALAGGRARACAHTAAQ
jgi:hypothetical protein